MAPQNSQRATNHSKFELSNETCRSDSSYEGGLVSLWMRRDYFQVPSTLMRKWIAKAKRKKDKKSEKKTKSV